MKSRRPRSGGRTTTSRSADEWFAIVGDLRASKLTVKAYAARHGYVVTTLGWWSSELSRRERSGERTAAKATTTNTFLPVVVSSSTPPRRPDVDQGIVIEVGPVIVRLPASSDLGDVVAFVHALRTEARC